MCRPEEHILFSNCRVNLLILFSEKQLDLGPHNSPPQADKDEHPQHDLNNHQQRQQGVLDEYVHPFESAYVKTTHLARHIGIDERFRPVQASLSRKTWSLAQSHHKLLLHLEWSRAYYHFIRCHQSLSLDRALPRPQRERTPALAAGLTGHRWRTLDILKMPLAAAGGG